MFFFYVSRIFYSGWTIIFHWKEFTTSDFFKWIWLDIVVYENTEKKDPSRQAPHSERNIRVANRAGFVYKYSNGDLWKIASWRNLMKFMYNKVWIWIRWRWHTLTHASNKTMIVNHLFINFIAAATIKSSYSLFSFLLRSFGSFNCVRSFNLGKNYKEIYDFSLQTSTW